MLAAITQLARQAGKIALERFAHLATLPVDTKGPLDLVTAADREIEVFINAGLRETFPDDGIFGEEGTQSFGSSGRTWVIDPIDGTFNFVRGNENWAISIGLFADGKPDFGVVHMPVQDKLYAGGSAIPSTCNGEDLQRLAPFDPGTAALSFGFNPSTAVEHRLNVLRFVMEEAGMTFRTNGSAVVSLLGVAHGDVDGYLGLVEHSWDVMGALPILAGLGGISSVDWSRLSLASDITIACGKPEFVRLMTPVLAACDR